MLPEGLLEDLVAEKHLTIGIYGEHRVGYVHQDGFEPGPLTL